MTRGNVRHILRQSVRQASRQGLRQKAGQSARRGVTLVELTVAMVVAAILGAALWAGFFADLRRFTVDQARLDGLQGALLLDEMLSRDLARLVLPAPADLERNGAVKIEADGGALAFLSTAEDAGAGSGPLVVETVRYAVDRATRTVTRTRGNRTEKLGGLRGADLEFVISDVRAGSALAAAGQSSHYGAAEAVRVLKYRLTCAPAGCERSLPGARDAARITVVGVLPVPHAHLRTYHPYWMPLELEQPVLADRRSR